MADIQFLRRSLDATDAVSQGRELVDRNYWLYFGVAFVATAGLLIVGMIPLVGFFLTGPVYVGVYRMLLLDMRGEPVNFGTMFSGFQRFVPAMVVGLIQSVPQLIIFAVQWSVDMGQLVFGSGGLSGLGTPSVDGVLGRVQTIFIVLILVFVLLNIVWSFVFFFTLELVADHEIGPLDAIILSARAAFSNVGRIIFLILIQIGISLVGALLCGIGIFFVLPYIFASSVFAYRQVFPRTLDPFNNFPPHPSAYGNQSGLGV